MKIVTCFILLCLPVACRNKSAGDEIQASKNEPKLNKPLVVHGKVDPYSNLKEWQDSNSKVLKYINYKNECWQRMEDDKFILVNRVFCE